MITMLNAVSVILNLDVTLQIYIEWNATKSYLSYLFGLLLAVLGMGYDGQLVKQCSCRLVGEFFVSVLAPVL